MGCKGCNLIRLLLLTTIALFSCAITEKERDIVLSREEDFEFNRRLKAINKPAIKTVKTNSGDIVDCIDIYKQPAFDHPLLKNHKIQTRPKSIPSDTFSKLSINNTFLQAKLETVQCPKGSVPIKRATKKDLLVDKYFRSLASQFTPEYLSHIQHLGRNIGAQGRLNVWRLANVPINQLSASNVRVRSTDGPEINDIQTGWIVYPGILDSETRIYGYYQGKNRSGCYNILCPGFIQVSSHNFLGAKYERYSFYGSSRLQYESAFKIYQDTETQHWWLQIYKEQVGYWPSSLFNHLQYGGGYITWGGLVISREKELSAPMGSGHLPVEGYGKAAFTRDIKVILPNNQLLDPDGEELTNYREGCYGVRYRNDSTKLGPLIQFGGPGQCKE